MKAVILAAGSGRRIKIHKPKGMLNIGGKPLIEYSISNLRKAGITEILIVTGYHADVYENHFMFHEDVNLIHNPEYANCGSLHSLHCALQHIDIDDDLVILDSDILYNWNEFEDFMKAPYSNSMLATNVPEGRSDACYLEVDLAENMVKVSKNINCVNFEDQPWEYIGITKTSKASLSLLRDYIAEKVSSTGTIDHEYDYAFESIDVKYKILKYPDYVWSEADDNQQLQYMVNIVYPKISL